MSLINEALKKAQRQRQQELIPAPSLAGHAPPVARARPRSTHSLLLLGAAGLALIGLSVVGTVLLLNRPPPPKPSAPTKTSPAAAARAAGAPASPGSPVISLGVAGPPAAGSTTAPADSAARPVSPAPSNATANAVATPASDASIVPTVQTTASLLRAAKMPSEAAKVSLAPSILVSAESGSSTPTSLAPAAAVALPPSATSPAQPPADATRDDRVQAFVDNLRVAGLRAFGDGSRVLMNDRVYRVGDMIERQLGVRLSMVEAGQLTFTDANGFNYVKRL